ncbi:acyl-CoA dehydrogenase family protein [Mesorhizobium sp. CAU 1732]|uniref:acyl-CoA dehydrogenase family protein n=1 Tax=Mesorhizobium sp. CAU 1732 TaxID=3140358 RepID=UPI0032609512
MDLSFTADEDAFRQEVRSFIKDNLPETTRRHMEQFRSPTRDMIVEWSRILHARGWGAPRWPAEYGGPGWDAVRQYIFIEECQAAPAPDLLSFGVNMVGPVIYTFGSAEQKARYLPRISSMEDWWCQGFSEPGAGSDLASLKTRAVRDGDGWVIDGQKTWTTYGQYANMIFVLARTNPGTKKQEGISFFLIDMNTPGITLRPIQTIDGGYEVNEVFFDNVRIPGDALVGQEDKGWDYAKFLLGNERVGIARIGISKGRMRLIRDAASASVRDGRPLIEHARFLDRFIGLEVELKALELTALRLLAAEAKRGNSTTADPASSVLKIKGAEIQQRTSELMLDVAGTAALPWPQGDESLRASTPGPSWADAAPALYFNLRKVSIYGGATEVQKNIIAKLILGL